MPDISRHRYDLAWSGRDRTFRPGFSLGGDDGRIKAAEEKINPNTAGAGSLRRCPMIGPVRANAIVEYRRKHPPAPFRRPSDLANVKGIGPRTVELMAPLLDLPDGDLP